LAEIAFSGFVSLARCAADLYILYTLGTKSISFFYRADDSFIGSNASSHVVWMRWAAEPDFRRDLPHRGVGPGVPETDYDPVYAIVYRVAEAVMEIAGPLFWAVLVVAFMTGPLGIDLFR
jgi:hypothetical protein